MNNVSKNNVFAARVELFKVSEAGGDFESGTPLTLNLYTTYLQITLPSLLKHCFSIFSFKRCYEIFRPRYSSYTIDCHL